MSYGSPEWQDWVIGDEQEVFKHIKYAYDHGIQTFDTANVCSWRSAIQVGYLNDYMRLGIFKWIIGSCTWKGYQGAKAPKRRARHHDKGSFGVLR